MRLTLRTGAKIIQCNRGSATVEFVALALPLFLPLFLFLNQYSVKSDLEGSLRTLGREMARAVVSSENDRIADDVANEIFFKGGKALGLSEEISSGEITYQLMCRRSPCVSPDNEIQVLISTPQLTHSISAIEFVSPWA